MSEWQQAPMTPHGPNQQPTYPWIQFLPETPQQLPPTPLSDRPVIGLEQYLESTSPPASPTPSNGSRGNSNAENQATNTGRSVLASPPRSLLDRLWTASMQEGD